MGTWNPWAVWFRGFSLGAAVCLGVFSTTGVGQGEPEAPDKEPPADLVSARTMFLEAVLSESQLLTEQYGRALGKTEIEAAERGDYQEALRVQRRRDELSSLYAGTASTLVQTEAISLPVETAYLSGGPELLRGNLEGWRSATSYAEWRGVSLAPGDYYLEFDCAMVEAPLISEGRPTRQPDKEPVAKAGFEFFEVSLLPGATDNRRGFDVKLTSDGATFESYRIGPISYPRSPVTLRLTAQTGFPLNIIRFHHLRLVPKQLEDELQAEAPQKSDAADSGRTLKAFQKSLGERLLEGYQSAVTSYASALRSWAGDDKNRKALVQSELASLKTQMAELKKNPGMPPPVMGMLGGFGGFEDVPEAMYVAGSATSGDEFQFRHEGGTFTVRLFGVRCMPPEGVDGEDATFFAQHFGISKEEATPLGLVAMEFATGYLEGKIVRVLVQPVRSNAPNQSRLALVFLPDVGLFQNVLVDQGLAAVRKEDAQRLKGAMPKAVISSLEAREKAARERSQPPGAWALQAEGRSSR